MNHVEPTYLLSCSFQEGLKRKELTGPFKAGEKEGTGGAFISAE